MTIGRKSISTVITVNNNETAQKSKTSGQNPKKPHEITVQVDKNYAVCDMSPRINEVLSDFQGRQLVYKDMTSGQLYLNEEVVSELENALNVVLNPKKED